MKNVLVFFTELQDLSWQHNEGALSGFAADQPIGHRQEQSGNHEGKLTGTNNLQTDGRGRESGGGNGLPLVTHTRSQSVSISLFGDKEWAQGD